MSKKKYLDKIVYTEWLHFSPHELNNLVDVLQFDEGTVLYYYIRRGELEIYLCIEEKMERNIREEIKANVKKMNDDETKEQMVTLKFRGIDQPGHKVETVAVKEYAVEIIDVALPKQEPGKEQGNEPVFQVNSISRPSISIVPASTKEEKDYELKIILPQMSIFIMDQNQELIKDGLDKVTLREIRTAFFKYGGRLIIGDNIFDYYKEDDKIWVECQDDVSNFYQIEPDEFNSFEDFLDFRL